MMEEDDLADLGQRDPAPVLMVLLASDAVEVRYADGSRLQLSPCGAVMKHHSKPSEDSHPIYGLTSVEQRVRFVTSAYRQKALQALDFRNRFADRPYLCPDLLPRESLVSLYADVGEALWPKNAARASTEILPDGSLRIVSEDEFASVVLSPHGHDFTVCYLSRISEDTPREKKGSADRRNRSQDHPQATSSTSGTASQSSDQCGTPRGNQGGLAAEVCSSTPEQPGMAPPFGRVSTPTGDAGMADEEDPVVTPFGKTASFQIHGHASMGQSPGMHDLSSISKVSVDNLCGTISTDQDLTFQAEPGPRSSMDRRENSGHECSGSSREGETSGHGEELEREEASSSCFLRYTWVTRHLSVNDCPPMWSQLLALATKAQQMSPALDSGAARGVAEKTGKKPDRRRCISSAFPAPLPLTCPSQHHHRWGTVESASGGDNSVAELPEERIKVIMADGVVYRLVHVATVQVVEVYPGDGSVMTSQGASGHLFSHLLVQNGQVRERSYSIKALPPACPGDAHSLQRTLKRANRILARSIQCEKAKGREHRPCWQCVPSKIVEPLPTSVLEECVVPGYGRFTAYTNGRVRVVFEDRVTVDMTHDFSRRVSSCARHSDLKNFGHQGTGDGQRVTLQSASGQLGSDTCRILQTNGKYVLVDSSRPGLFHRYVAAAKEWAAWVNALPEERVMFYNAIHNATNPQLSAEAELKKILCFNYIIENTVLQHSNAVGHEVSKQLSPNGHQPSSNVFCTSGAGTTDNSGGYGGPSPPSSGQRAPGVQSSLPWVQPGLGVPASVTSTAPSSSLPSRTLENFSSLETLRGFHNVRQALLQTSKMIQDIDEILEKKGT